MVYILQHFGVGIAAITGVMAARGKRVDLFGVVVLALVTAIGGGTIRDCTLGRLPVFWVKDPNYVFTAVATAVLTFYLARTRQFPHTALLIADAFALAFFTIVGLKTALSCSVSPGIAVAMGVVTGVAGGILRDLLLGEIPLVFRPEIYLYATAAFAGAVLFVASAPYLSDDPLDTALSIGTILALRLAGIRWRISLPVFEDKAPAQD